MRIAFVVERPTQFEAPFYRFVAAEAPEQLHVFFTEDASSDVFDPELGRRISWGIDLVGGYAHERLPAKQADVAARLADFDLVIVNGYTRGPYLRAAWAARRSGARTALRIDSVLDASSPPALSKRLLFALGLERVFDFFLATGTLTREYLAACGVPARRVGLFPYAVDVAAFREGAARAAAEGPARRGRFGLPAEGRVVLSLAKFSAREAPWDALRAAALRRHPGICWALAGDGPLRGELERFVAQSALENVRFLGYVPYGELPALYAAADLFVHPAREERWGVSVAEALAAGLPVVASSKVGSARDLVAPGRNGFTYDAGDELGLAERVTAALALDRVMVEEESRRILAAWDYAAAWQALLEAAGR